MNANETLTLEPAREAQEVATLVDDLSSILKLRARRPDATGARVVAIGRVLSALERLAQPATSEAPDKPVMEA